MELVTTETSRGRVAGKRGDDGIVVFLGIPYAAPPIGEARWRPPAPGRAWGGVREALSPAPNPLQPPPDLASTVPGDPIEQSEDCLYLNVFTPACDEERRPVMVWMHGGGFVSGSPSSALYDGRRLAAHGAVVVNVGYRLGALGWLAHRALADPAHEAAGFANWGLLDQQAALAWVRANAASFGGDPANVTVFGESAGAISVAALLATSAPRRLFERAILQSGAAMAWGEETGARVAEELARELGLDSPSRERLLAVPADALLRAQMAVSRRYEVLGLPFQPVVDGMSLTGHPASRIAAGSAAGVDLLVGTNRDEWRFWAWSNPALRDLSEEKVLLLVAEQVENIGLSGVLDPAGVVELYRKERTGRGAGTDPVDLYSAIATDWTFRVPSMRLAAGHQGRLGRVFAYLFDWESPLFHGALGSCHALELPFVFGSCRHEFIGLLSGTGEEAEALSSAMRQAWVSFAATGDPSSGPVGGWPVYEAGRRATKRLGATIETLEAPMEAERAFLDEAFGPYGVLEAANTKRPRLKPKAA